MKVLHVINSMIVGGAEVLLRDAVIGINKFYPNVEQHLVTLYGGGKQLDPILDIVSYKDLSANYYNFIFKAIELKKYIKDNNIDVVHAHLYDAMILARLSTPRKIKLLYTYHSGLHHPESNDYSLIRTLIDKLTYKSTDVTIFVSKTVKNEIICGVKIYGASYVIYNFTSSIFNFQYKFKANQELKIVSVGNLRKTKNHANSINVIASLKNYPITLDIYGNGLLKNDLENLIKLTGANVKIITDINLTSKILSQYDLFFMSSFQEGMSVALLEAMTTGLPSVLSNIDSFQETAEDSSLYFDLNNKLEAENKFLEIFNNKLILKKMSENAKRLSINYSFEEYLRKLLELYFAH